MEGTKLFRSSAELEFPCKLLSLQTADYFSRYKNKPPATLIYSTEQFSRLTAYAFDQVIELLSLLKMTASLLDILAIPFLLVPIVRAAPVSLESIDSVVSVSRN